MIAFSCADGEGVVWKTVVRIDDAAVFYEASFLLGDKLILASKLVTKGLNEVVLGFKLTGVSFEKGGFFRFKRLDGLHLRGKGGVDGTGCIDGSGCRDGGS